MASRMSAEQQRIKRRVERRANQENMADPQNGKTDKNDRLTTILEAADEGESISRSKNIFFITLIFCLKIKQANQVPQMNLFGDYCICANEL